MHKFSIRQKTKRFWIVVSILIVGIIGIFSSTVLATVGMSPMASNLNNFTTFNQCDRYQPNTPVTASSTAETLVGFWNFKVSSVSTTYQIKIEFNETDKLSGHYIIPSNNDSLFKFDVYDFPGRGRPVITIAQIAKLKPNSSYRAVLSGRLDNECLITGDLVDIDNNRATFEMIKQ
jgi:hypothetical protein